MDGHLLFHIVFICLFSIMLIFNPLTPVWFTGVYDNAATSFMITVQNTVYLHPCVHILGNMCTGEHKLLK